MRNIISIYLSVLILAACQQTAETDVSEVITLISKQFPESGQFFQEMPRSGYSQSPQILSGAHKGKVFAAYYIKADNNHFWHFPDPNLFDANIHHWAHIGDEPVKLGAVESSETPFERLKFRRFKVRKEECIDFAAALQFSQFFTDKRRTQQLTGYFCQKPNEPLSAIEIKEFFNGFAVSLQNVKAPSTSQTGEAGLPAPPHKLLNRNLIFTQTYSG